VALGAEKEVPKAVRAPGQRLTPEELEKRAREEWERNREKQRTEIVNDALASTRLMWGFIGGGATFVVALILLFVIDSFLSGNRNYPLGMSRLVFTILGFVFSVALAAVGALVTSKKMGEKTRSQLQHLSLEELQRRGH
jgi:F0F1-type ATP synthase assembly protein I